jgi:hypothetical protein
MASWTRPTCVPAKPSRRFRGADGDSGDHCKADHTIDRPAAPSVTRRVSASAVVNGSCRSTPLANVYHQYRQQVRQRVHDPEEQGRLPTK